MTPSHSIPPLLTSLTRISDFQSNGFDVLPWPRDKWEMGDYVLGEIHGAADPTGRLELTDGREICPAVGDRVIGALGTRAATLEAVGDWRDIRDDNVIDVMTAAGLLGRITSQSLYMGPTIQLRYRGHIVRNNVKVVMSQFARLDDPLVRFDTPTVLIIGTSMSSGKTMSGRVVVRLLAQAGLRVVGAKLTGAGRYRDILAFRDSGAAAVYDFVDSGLPSTVCSREVYERSLVGLLSRIASESPNVVVAEAGASPLEPYNGDTAVGRLQPNVRFTILCASDPYAVVGVTQGFGFQPDLVAGVAASTSAGCQVVEKLTGLRVLNLLDPGTHKDLEQILRARVGY